MRWLIGLFIVLTLIGCAAPPPEEPQEAPVDIQADLAEEPPTETRLGPEPVIIPDLYTFKAGDELEISVIGDEDETLRTVPVGPDGRIQYLTARDVYAAGKTFHELALELEEELKEIYKQPRVSIIGKEYAGNAVTVLGMVRQPGRYEVKSDSRILDVIAKAGGIPLVNQNSLFGDALELADLGRAQLLRGPEVISVNFEALLSGNPSGMVRNNVVVQPGDTVYIPSAVGLDNKIFVLGEVNQPGMYRYQKEISLVEAIALAGQPTARGWERRGFVVRGSLKQPDIIPVNVRKIMTGKVKNIQLSPRDIVYIPTTPLGKMEEVVRQVLPTLESMDIGDRVYQRWAE